MSLAAEVAGQQVIIGQITAATSVAWECLPTACGGGELTDVVARTPVLTVVRPDGSQTSHALVENCTALVPATLGITCKAPLDDAARTAMTGYGGFEMVLKITDLAGQPVTPDSYPVRFAVPTACPRVGPTGQIDTTMTVPIGGSFGVRSTASTPEWAARVVGLAQQGYRLHQVQRVQFAAPSGPAATDGGYFYLVAECVGVPQ
jgi:hypothetical protein